MRDAAHRAAAELLPRGLEPELEAVGEFLAEHALRAYREQHRSSMMARASDAFTPVDTAPADPAVIIYTSGTTGRPKGVLVAMSALEAQLQARGDRLKEFSLAVDVFARPSTFDPRVDSIVRVQASRLRALLAEYYTKDGASETVRVEIPAGGYVATFSRATPQARPPVQNSPAKDDTLGEPPMRKASCGCAATTALPKRSSA